MTKISEVYEVLSDQKSDPAPPSFSAVKARFQKWLHLPDPDVLDIVFGTVVAETLPGERVWLMVVAPAGGMKTELIRSFDLTPKTYAVSTLSARSLISGARREGQEDPSLLPKLDGKVLFVKDFTTILTLPAGERREILGVLRDAYDGHTSKQFGHIGTVAVRSRFGLIAGVTPVIDKYADVESELGERYLKVRIQNSDPMATIRRALDNSGQEAAMRAELQAVVGRFFYQNTFDEDAANVAIEPNINERLIGLAHLTATIRSRVPRHWKHDTLEYLPEAEMGTRLVKQLSQLAKGIALLRGEPCVSERVFGLIRRVARDSVPALRRRVVDALCETSDVASTESVAQRAGFPTKATRGVLEDLTLLRVVERDTLAHKRGQPHGWRLSPGFRSLMEGGSPENT